MRKHAQPCFYLVILFLFLSLAKVLHIHSLHHLLAVNHRWFVKLLTCAEFFDNTCSFKFSFEFLEGSFNVFAVFYWNYDHFCFKI